MADMRSRREKLQAMAADKSSPREAAIAQRLLDTMPDEQSPVSRVAAEAWARAVDNVTVRTYADSTGASMTFEFHTDKWW